MLSEAIEGLNIKEDGKYVDCTLGYAGHSSEILKRLKRGFLFALDQDMEAIKYSEKKLSEISLNFKIIHSNFENMKEKLNEEGIEKVDGILFDLGLSSPQIDDASRGFSFMNEARLDMRMNKEAKKDAYYVVNNYSKEMLAEILFKYGEEKLSNVIAKKIVDSRPITTTTELVEVIKSAVGANYFFKSHPEREIFQAIRIEVNDELKVLEKVLPDAIEMLNKGGRISVITFHSLEDRIVKQIFKQYSEVDPIFKGMPDIPDEYKPIIKLVNKKPILPSEEELKNNSRSKSAKLRIIERM
jgi:16S rRNA (cytosine1402-N4)-methyltransferase